MKKKFFFAAVALVALASCSNEEIIGDSPTPNPEKASNAIVFNSGAKAITRTTWTGATAAEKLNNNFVVEGIKTISTATEVFDNYNVNWYENTANKTASNTANWEYVGQSILTGKTAVAEQTIKYWDFSAKQYDFWAYSLGGGSASVISLEPGATLTTSAYTITGTKTNLSKVYISDLQTAYNPNNTVSEVTGTAPFVMGNEVLLTFRSLVTKVRVGLYETIPGYSVRDVKFYPAAEGTPAGAVVLYGTGNNIPTFTGTGADATATYEVKFLTIGKENIGKSDYNKAHVALAASGTKTSTVEFGTLTYGAKESGKNEKTTGNVWVQRSTSQPTWATESGASPGDYSIVLPNENGEVLTLKVDYTLESIDGSGEAINVYGATALVPRQYTQWKPNYAYTYIFKISDNTNGLTNKTVTDKVGLYPITFNAVVISPEDGTQETITTVATPSITTYSLTSNVTTNNEYTTSDDIYVTATENGTLIDMDETGHGATLYTVSKTTATEAEVLDALNTYVSNTSGTYVGRNNITLAPVSGGLDLSKTAIPLVDGNSFTGLTAGQVALIDKSKLSVGTYAFVYKVSAADASPTKKYEEVTLAANADATGYFTTNDGTDTAATTNTTATQVVYARYYVVDNVTYAIKVIKVV